MNLISSCGRVVGICRYRRVRCRVLMVIVMVPRRFRFILISVILMFRRFRVYVLNAWSRVPYRVMFVSNR